MLAKGRLRATLAMLGPAFVASIAYVDPGNFATNLQGGAKYGYLLLWVVLLANLIAMLIQYLSAKLGVVTGHSLPENIRGQWSRAVSWGMWIQAEIMAMSTDIAEFLGAALGLNLLFGVPMLVGGADHRRDRLRDPRAPDPGFPAVRARDHRRSSAIIFLGFLYETLRIGPSVARGAARSASRPGWRWLGLPRGRDHRRHRDAARDLPPLRARRRRGCRSATSRSGPGC